MWQLLVRRSPNKLCDSIQSTVGRSSYRIQRADRSGDDLHGSAGGRGCRMEFVKKILVGEGSNTDDYEIALRSQNCGTVGFERRVPRYFCDDVGTEVEEIIQRVDNRNVMNIASHAMALDQGTDNLRPRPSME